MTFFIIFVQSLKSGIGEVLFEQADLSIKLENTFINIPRNMDADSNTKKLIIVDDDLPSRILIFEILERANVVIIECGRGSEAVCLFRKHFADIVMILLDIDLPKCNGWDLGKRFREMKPEVIIIAVSAISPDELALGCQKGGFDGFVSKPFDIDVFLKIVTSYL